jgi:hypothetical protein
MVQRFPPALGGSNGDVQVVLNLVLPDELIKTAGSETGVKRYVLGTGLA